MYLTPDNNNKPDETVKDVQRMLNRIREHFHHDWPTLDTDGRYGRQSAMAVEAFQMWRHVSSQKSAQGVILGDTTVEYIRQTHTFISISSSGMKVAGGGYEMVKAGVPVFENSYMIGGKMEELLRKTGEVLSQQASNLERRIAKIPNNPKVRNLKKILKSAEEFIEKAKKNGVDDAAKVVYGELTKDEVVKYLKNCSIAITESSHFKMVTKIGGFLTKLKAALKPLADFLNSIPGLKYLAAFDKLYKGTSEMVKGNFEEAAKLYMDSIRVVLETILIDAAVAAVIALGGWIAIVLVIIILVVVMLVDYFFFSDNPGDSLTDKKLGIPTTNLVTEYIAPAVYNKANPSISNTLTRRK